MRIVVVGLGKIGLPLAVQYSSKGHSVTGADIDPRVVELVEAGLPPFPGEAHLDERLPEVVSKGLLSATTDTASAVSAAEVVVVVVPLFVDSLGTPDFVTMDKAVDAIGEGLTPGTLVVFETTLPVGTTRGRWKPRLEERSGLVEGRDFHVAFSPERVLTGRVFADLRKYPKLIGALSIEGSVATRAFYEAVLDFDDRPDLDRPNGVWDLGSAEAAEMAKLAETTYRDVNIALANQFAIFAASQGIDIYQVIAASNSQPYSHIHSPGIAVGGHCIPVYPRLYLSTDPDASVVRTARAVNAGMPAYAVQLAEQAHGSLDGQRVLVLGAAYRGGVKETAFSGVFDVVHHLVERGASVAVHDPLYSDEELSALGFEPHRPGTPVDVVVVQTDHAEYAAVGESDFPGVRTIVDGRRIVRADAFPTARTVVLGDGSGLITDR